MFRSLFILTSIVLSTLASPVPAPVSPCAAVHIIAGRGSNEAAGPGGVGALVEAIRNQSKQTVSTSSVDYPATLTNYNNSSAKGTAATKTLLTNQVNACPNQKIVMVGYSQGAHIIGDAVAGGGGGSLGSTTAPVAASISNKVVAIIHFGDPRRVGGKSFNKGTSTNRSGLFPRPAALDYTSTLASRIQSFCDSGDPVCDGGLNLNAHAISSYLGKYQSSAVSFVLNQIGD
ncbi:cutinase [Panaeolus papilionaceus]|nr:cutinase [Panaeolus papilionaceus]